MKVTNIYSRTTILEYFLEYSVLRAPSPGRISELGLLDGNRRGHQCSLGRRAIREIVNKLTTRVCENDVFAIDVRRDCWSSSELDLVTSMVRVDAPPIGVRARVM